MTANPIELVGGMTTTGNVPKADIVAWAKARVPQVMESPTEVNDTVMGVQLVIYVKSLTAYFVLDTGDTTTPDNGTTVLVSDDNKRFKIVSAIPAPTALSLGGVFSKVAVSHQWLKSLGTDGAFTSTQPAAADLSDGLTGAGLVVLATAPSIVGGTHDALTSLGIRSTAAAYDVKFASAETLSATRTLSLVMGDANRSITLAGNLSYGGAFTMSGAYAFTGTLTGATGVTFPTTGTLATLAGAEALTNKSVNGVTITPSTGTLTIANGKIASVSNTLTFTGTDGTSFVFPATGGTLATLTLAQTFTNKTIDASANTLSNLTTAMFAANVVDTDSTLAANSTTRLPSQSAVKSYVDNYLTGLQWKTAVAVATTANITLSGEQTIDGVLTSASRILVKNQSTGSQNGIYVTASGSWTRATDMDAAAEFPSATVFVRGGTVNGDTQWTCTNDSVTVGSTAVVFAQVSGAGTYSAGTGLVLTGNQFTIDSTVATLTGSQALTNKTYNGNTWTAGTGVLTLAAAKTLTVNNTLTMTATDGSTAAFGAGGTVAYVANKLSAFAATTSSELAGIISDETGSGALVFANTPTLVTPVLGVATATSINKVAITAPATSATLTIANGKTLTVSNTLTFTGTDSSSVAFGTGGTVLYSGGALGTPSGGTATNLTGLPISTGLTGAGTGVLAALAVAVGSAGAPVLFNGAGGTPSSLTLTNATGLPTAGLVNNAVTLGKMAQVATARFLGRTTASTGDVEALTVTQATAMLNAMVGDTGSGGTKGLVPAAGAGDAAAGKFLKADGTFAVPAGGGGGSLSDADRQNILLDRIYQAKLFAAPRRALSTFADGFMSSTGISAARSSNYSVTSSSAASSYVAPTSTAGSAPSYANSGGTGNRTASITVTTNISLASGSGSDLVDSTKASSGFDPTNTQSVSGLYARFDFGSGQSKVINEAKFFGSSSSSEGTWKWQGSNDAAAWTDIGSSFSLADATAGSGSVIGDMSANTAGWRYYQIVGVSGSTAGGGSPFWQEFEFKIDNYSAPSVNSMVLVTTPQTADGSVSNARVLLEFDNTATPTLNTDLTVEVACKLSTSTITVTIASPGVVTHTAHGLSANDAVSFTTSGALPTGIVSGTIYFVKTVSDANTYTLSATPGGTVIATTGSQSGTHTASYYLWTSASLSNAGTSQSGRSVAETVDQACTSGNSFAARIKTFNSKNVPIYGVAVSVH